MAGQGGQRGLQPVALHARTARMQQQRTFGYRALHALHQGAKNSTMTSLSPASACTRACEAKRGAHSHTRAHAMHSRQV